jgi:predicted 2-oxoglutarate/Fe(II)-dependent dioxygenase YbiX
LSEAFPRFLAAVLGTERLHPMACRYQAINISVMGEGGCQNWHFDSSNFTITLMLQKPETGGEFQCVPFLRSEENENYEGVARVMDGDTGGLLTIPFEAGTLMIFQGHRSLHRVNRVAGQTRRLLTIMHYDTRPGLLGRDEVNRNLYGPRVEPQAA